MLAQAEELAAEKFLTNINLAKLFSGRQVAIQFVMDNVRSAFSEDCAVLHLEHGAAVACQVAIDSGQNFSIYGER